MIRWYHGAMGKLSVCVSFALVLAACGSSSSNKNDGGGGGGGGIDAPGTGIDAKVFMDAPGPFSCVGDSAPTTANPNVTFSGTVSDVTIVPMVGLSPASGATVDACTSDCMNANKLGTATTDSSGAFSIGPLST